MFEYMAMAKPVVANVVANEEIFEHKAVLEESGGGSRTRKARLQAG
jgi:hypothetical protein